MAFTKPGAAKGKPAAPKKKSRWGGVPSTSGDDRMPIISASANSQRIRIDSCEITYNEGSGHESFKVSATIIHSDVHEAGTAVLVGPFIINGKSKRIGEGRVKAMAVAAIGCEGDEDFDALYPEDSEVNPVDLALEGREGDDSFLGHEVDVMVSKGGAREGGDYFREYEWQAVP